MLELHGHLSFWWPSLQEIAVNFGVNLASDQTGSEREHRGSLPTSKTMNKQFKFFMPGRISLISVKCLVSSAISFSLLRQTSSRTNHHAAYKELLTMTSFTRALKYWQGLGNEDYWIDNQRCSGMLTIIKL